MSNYLLELNTQDNTYLALIVIMGIAFLLFFCKHTPHEDYHEAIWHDDAKEIELEERFEEEDIYE